MYVLKMRGVRQLIVSKYSAPPWSSCRTTYVGGRGKRRQFRMQFHSNRHAAKKKNKNWNLPAANNRMNEFDKKCFHSFNFYPTHKNCMELVKHICMRLYNKHMHTTGPPICTHTTLYGVCVCVCKCDRIKINLINHYCGRVCAILNKIKLRNSYAPERVIFLSLTSR